MSGLGPGDRGYNPPAESVLRAIRAEARRDERIRIHDDLVTARLRVSGLKASTVEGRRAYGLEQAESIVQHYAWYDDGPWDDPVGSISAEVDGVEVGVYTERDEDGAVDTMPVRLRVFDGGDSTIACAYLTSAESREIAALLTEAADRADALDGTS